jgi:ABC-type multidrug transport system ATPase subunit
MTTAQQIASLTAQVEALTALMTTQVTSQVAKVDRVVAVPKGKLVDLSDPSQVAKSKAARKVSKFFKGGDANNPIGYGQRKRLMALADRGPEWKSYDGLTTAQAAVASFYLERNHPVKIGDLTLTPTTHIR